MVEHRKRLSRVGALFAFLLALLLAAPAAHAAGFGVGQFTTTASSSQAGAHADFSIFFSLRTDALGNPVGRMKDVRIEMPEGLLGDPRALERCSFRSFSGGACQPQAQIGTFSLALVPCRGFTTPLIATAEVGATELQVESTDGMCEEGQQPNGNVITIGSGPTAEQVQISRPLTKNSVELVAPVQQEHASGEPVTHIGEPIEGPLPLFNLAPFPGHVATLGTFILGVTFLIQADVDPQGNLVATIEDASSQLKLAGGDVTLWGFPGDPRHDPERCNEFLFECGLTVAREAPFLSLPAECTGQPLRTAIALTSWQGETATSTATEPALSGCNLLSIEPSLRVAPETTAADSPSGYEIGITMPQRREPNGPATPPLKDIALTLPPGTSMSPAFADGLATCAEAQLAIEACPNASKIGSVEVDTPLLDEPLKGAVYFGAPTAAVKYPLLVRLANSRAEIQFSGRAVPDPQTGQVVASFENAPELPFEEMHIDLFGGSTAALDNPQTCGSAVSAAELTAYGGASAAPTSSFTVEGNCGTPFAPGFIAGTKLAKAAAFSPLSITLTRADGEPEFGSFVAQLPPGLIGLLGSVTPCGEPQAATGECPPSSAVGTATVGAGAGPTPLFLSGPVYLTGPYGDAPFGLDVLIHAAAGPVDLGNVLVRSRLSLDQKTLGLKIVSGALPQIVGGVRLRTRSINITMDRPGLMINPSTCGPGAITATAVSTTGVSRALSTPFGVLGCSGLRFAPNVTAAAGPGGSRAGNGVGLRMRIAPGGVTKASLGKVSITLPRLLRARLTTIQDACLPGTASLEAACTGNSIVGTASIVTPAISQALSGDVYLVARGSGVKPTLALVLHGGGVTQQLEGALTISAGHVIKATFAGLPDIPIEEMNLNLPRGPHSMLGAIGRLCGNRLRLGYTMTDQSGRTVQSASRVAVKGCGRKRPGH